ncbi:MAG: 3-hydroxyacyl-CoA dehydrogenase NAD-binding domain-containing protein [Gammaproteobacteria bacterium]|nr:3-hydroxyacyl-CoA dehydrogenase NAD-binding domain-containing protein [Gammaproteobacteria bacterium]
MSDYKHWDQQIDAQNIVWLGLNRQHASVNTINNEVLDEFNLILQALNHGSDIIGLVIYSMKKQGFIAGADVHEFAHFKSKQLILDFLRKGQAVFARLEALTFPTVAMIDGFCMGGGLELALACDYRLATEASRLGLPEVKLGIHPGWGGTVRLPKLIGGFPALSEVILTGSALSAKRAKSLGILDDVVAKRQLKRAAAYFIMKKPNPHQPSMLQSLTKLSWVRALAAKGLRHFVSGKIDKAHYPAPFAAIDLWEKEGGFDDRAYLKEADSVEKLISKSETAPNLVRLFLLRDRLKDFAKESAHPVTHVHVIGAGVMGGDIAAWCALRGLTVTLQDQTAERIAPAIKRAFALYSKQLRKPRLIQAAMDKLIPDPDGDGVGYADVIIEAVFEDLEVKQTIMKQVEAKARPDALIATNTSSIPLQEMSEVMKNPERLVGIHFFNPVAKMELVEVVHAKKTAQKVIQQSCAFVNQIGRLPLPVTSSPGFLINRVLMPYLLEAVLLLEEGFKPEAIDEAACHFGMMMGPIELADTVGLDICLAVAQNLTSHLGGSVPVKLEAMVAEGKLGRKSPEGGFYHYNKGKIVKKKLSAQKKHPELATRLIDAMISEAQVCLRDGVVADADLLDVGMVFATGFAPFRGGPMHYAQSMHQDKDEHAAEDIPKVVPAE